MIWWIIVYGWTWLAVVDYQVTQYRISIIALNGWSYRQESSCIWCITNWSLNPDLLASSHSFSFVHCAVNRVSKWSWKAINFSLKKSTKKDFTDTTIDEILVYNLPTTKFLLDWWYLCNIKNPWILALHKPDLRVKSLVVSSRQVTRFDKLESKWIFVSSSY